MDPMKQKLRELAQEGDGASISLMRDIVVEHNPYLAPLAFDLLVEVKSRDAEDAIFKIMQTYPKEHGMQGIEALEKTKSDYALGDIHNFISLVEMDDGVRVAHLFHALNVLHDSNNPTSNKIAAGLLDLNPLLPSLRVEILRERAIGGEEDAIDAIGEVASLSPDSIEDVFDALLEIDTDHAREVYEKIRQNIQASDDINYKLDSPDMGFLGNLGIDSAPDDDSPQEGPIL